MGASPTQEPPGPLPRCCFVFARWNSDCAATSANLPRWVPIPTTNSPAAYRSSQEYAALCSFASLFFFLVVFLMQMAGFSTHSTS